MSVVLRSAQNSVLVLTTANLYTSMNLVVYNLHYHCSVYALAIGIGDENY